MAVLHSTALAGVNYGVLFMKTSFHSIKIEAIKFGSMQHMQLIAWNKRKIWKPKQYKITTTLPPRNILQLQLRS